jgi:hypothetical protein
VTVASTALYGNTNSCGCLHREMLLDRNNKNSTHKMSDHFVYRRWGKMKERCLNPKRKDYKNYGGRGIKICERWLVFENFLEDMGIPPRELSIDRIDHDGNYEPGNCRWATAEQQQNNRSVSRFIVFNNEKFTIAQWAKKIGASRQAVRYRLNQGWTPQQILETKFSHANRNVKK